MGRRRYTVDLTGWHAVCEANYARMMRLFPGYEVSNHTEFALLDERVVIDVIERSRYTTIFRIGARPLKQGWMTPLRMEVRAYHDAGMAEVSSFQASGAVQARYTYPNPAMHQQDEKSQQNRFLADWLEHCLAHGMATLPAGHQPAQKV
jgi:uncharacterized protein YqiB (DUF1249 family)